MPTTPNLGLPYPGLTNAPNVPADIQALATALDVLPLTACANMGTPTSTASDGTTFGTTELRDTVLGNYVFTAVAGRRYQVIYSGMVLGFDTAGDIGIIRIRNGGASTPTATSTLIASGQSKGVDVGGGSSGNYMGTFVPGAGVQTLSAFGIRYSTGGTMTPTNQRELYVVDLGPA